MSRKPVNRLSLDQRVLGFIQEYRLVGKGQMLLVAVSGGQDSVCLLHVLYRLQTALGIKLHAAHLDHQLRGKESTGDAAYVARLAKQLGIACTVKKGNVRVYQKTHGVSLEEAAREVRYDFLAETAAAIGADRVAVGHTLDDHVETILLHLVRGTGTRGLRGLQPVTMRQSPNRELTIIRPLLTVRRKETAEYCSEYDLQPRQDSTNLSLEPLRNRVRLSLLPLLQSYNPQVVEALQRTAQIAGDDIAYLEKTAARLYRKLAVCQGETIILDKKAMLKQSFSMRRYLLRLAIENAAGNLKDIEARHIEELVSALDKPAGKQIHLPYGLIFTVDYDTYKLAKDNSALIPFPVLEGEYPIKTPGITLIPGWQIQTEIIKPDAFAASGENSFTAHFDYAKINGELTVRARKRCDRFQPLGMREMKKTGQFMLDAKIPHDWRDRVPVVACGDSILWLAGFRIDERFKVTAGTKKVLRLEFIRI
jgi:tRNA(Ile)-lysidine synthase